DFRTSEQKQREREQPPALVFLRKLILEPALQFGLVRMELDRVDFIHELLQLVGGNVVPHRFLSPAEKLIVWLSAGRLATFHGKRAGFPARSRWSAGGRN